jgi:hypothetical protein
MNCGGPEKPPQLSQSIVQTKINTLVAPLKKLSPRGDTGNEPVFLPSVPKRGKRNHRFLGVKHEGRHRTPAAEFCSETGLHALV